MDEIRLSDEGYNTLDFKASKQVLDFVDKYICGNNKKAKKHCHCERCGCRKKNSKPNTAKTCPICGEPASSGDGITCKKCGEPIINPKKD